MKSAVCACLLAAVASGAAAQNQFVYTDNEIAPVNTVTAFQVGSQGTLTQIAGSPFSTEGQGGQGPINAITIATTRSGFYLYAANDGDGTVSAFKIDLTTGGLALVAGSPFPGRWPRHQQLFVSQQSQRSISVCHQRRHRDHPCVFHPKLWRLAGSIRFPFSGRGQYGRTKGHPERALSDSR